MGALPVEVAFLAGHGVPIRLLHAAARLAREEGVDAVQALLAHGLATQEIVYRALAAEIGAPFLERPSLDRRARFPESLHSGLAPLAAGAGIVAAPRAGAFVALLVRRVAPVAFCVTTPAALAEAVFALRRTEIAEEAANGLSAREPDLSFRGGFGRRQSVVVLSICIGLAATAILAPGAVVAPAVLAGLLFISMATLRLATCLEAVPLAPAHPSARAADVELPVYTIVVPLHREAAVVHGLCNALRALDYPLSRLDVKLVVEEDDAQTRAAIARLALPSAFEIVVAPAGLPRTKPRALNVALPLARGAFLVVYDAEDRPDPDQLRLAVAAFAREGPEVACLQARLSIHNRTGWLARLFAIEYAALFDVVNPALTRYGLPIPLGGTSNHFRTASLRRIHGWDAHNVTEDADLGMRLSTHGLRTVDLPSTTREEAPATLGNWMRQRARWMKGFMQVCVVHTRAPARTAARMGAGASVALVLLVGGTVLSALAYPVFVGLVVACALAAAGLVSWPLPIGAQGLGSHGFGPQDFGPLLLATLAGSTALSGIVSIYAPALVGCLRRRWFSLIPFALTLPVYYVLVSLAAWRGLYELLTRPTHWHKTEHGHALPPEEAWAARSARSPPPVQIRRNSSAAASAGSRVVSRPATKRPCPSMM